MATLDEHLENKLNELLTIKFDKLKILIDNLILENLELKDKIKNMTMKLKIAEDNIYNLQNNVNDIKEQINLIEK
jgi:hypothetical protein